MNNPPELSNGDRIAQLREKIGAIESTRAGTSRPAPPAKKSNAQSTPSTSPTPPGINYPGMPEGDDWQQRVPARYHDGEDGFEHRIMAQLAAIGVPCYTLDDLTKVRTIPQAIPLFIDWLTHLEERIPGPESRHRQIIRANLIRNLNDSAARGNLAAIDVLIDQLRRQPPLSGGAPDYAGYALARIATKKDFPRIAKLIDELPREVPKGSLIEYLGKVKTAEAQAIALRYLDDGWAYFALRALIAMKAAGVRSRVEPYLHDANAMVRKEARRAMDKLPA